MKLFTGIIPLTTVLIMSLVQTMYAQIDYSQIDFSEPDFYGCNNNDFDTPDGVFRFSAVRFTGEQSKCIGGLFGPPTISMFTDHKGEHTMSMPVITIGNDWGHYTKQVHLPAKIKDIEALRASVVFKVPNWDGSRHTRSADGYRIYFQMYLSTNGDARAPDQGDFCVNVYHSPDASDNWWQHKDYGYAEFEGHRYLMSDQGDNVFGSGPFRTAILKPNPVPDENGIVKVFNIDIGSIAHFYTKNGRGYHPDDYLKVIQFGMENFNVDGRVEFLDIAYYIDVVGKEPQLLPQWTSLANTLEAGSMFEGKVKLTTATQGHGVVKVLPAQSFFDPGTEISLQAVANPRHVFTGWTGDKQGTDENLVFEITNDLQIEAQFALDPQAPLVLNGDFSDGLSYWDHFQWHESGSSGSVSTELKKAEISVSNGGSAIWHQQLHQKDIPIKSGEQLQLSFTASSPTGRSINVALKSMNPDQIYVNQTIKLTSEMKNYTFYFSVDQQVDKFPQLEFNFGTATGDVVIDDVWIGDKTTTHSIGEVTGLSSPNNARILHKGSEIKWSGLATQPWHLEAFDLMGNKIASSQGSGNVAILNIAGYIPSRSIVVLRLSQDQKTITEMVHLAR